jgi:hypothetical protein
MRRISLILFRPYGAYNQVIWLSRAMPDSNLCKAYGLRK